MASDGEALTGLWIEGQLYFARTLDQEVKACNLPIFEDTRRWLDVYFSGKCPDFTPIMRPHLTPFQQMVSACMRQIPYGQTTTYQAIARKVAEQSGKTRMSAQAVGGAVGHNPISILIPCHRVVGSNGSLTGYAGGLAIKTQLLRLEGLQVEDNFIR